MAKILVLYYSSWGHMEQMAKAAAEGAREAGATVTIKRVKELVPEEVAKAAYYKLDQEAPIADPLELENYDGFIFGVSTRYGLMASQLKNFFDQTGPLWVKGALINKVATVMSSTATQHGGAETGDPDHAGLAAASRHDHRAALLCLPGPVGQRRGARRRALRHDHDVELGRLAPAFRAGARRRQVPGQAAGRDHHQAARLS